MHNNAKASSKTVTKSEIFEIAFCCEYFTFPTTEGRKYLCSRYRRCFSTVSMPTIGCDLLLVKLSIGKGSSFLIIISERKQSRQKQKRDEKWVSLGREIFSNNELQWNTYFWSPLWCILEHFPFFALFQRPHPVCKSSRRKRLCFPFWNDELFYFLMKMGC